MSDITVKLNGVEIQDGEIVDFDILNTNHVQLLLNEPDAGITANVKLNVQNKSYRMTFVEIIDGKTHYEFYILPFSLEGNGEIMNVTVGIDDNEHLQKK
jgi:hypothetical protein